jgi:hypothetical protein
MRALCASAPCAARLQCLRAPLRAANAAAPRRAPGLLPCRASAAAPAAAASQARPSSEACARTLVDICDRGTVATTTEDGWPMGTHAAYLLDNEGQPLLRLRKDAAHTEHVLRDARCSLYVQARAPVAAGISLPPTDARAAPQPFTQPGGVMSRATLLGRVEQLSGDALAEAQQRFAVAHSGRTGVDAVQPTDLYFRLIVERVFFVGGLGSVRVARATRRGCSG